jgi:hypothetical protein
MLKAVKPSSTRAERPAAHLSPPYAATSLQTSPCFEQFTIVDEVRAECASYRREALPFSTALMPTPMLLP